MRAAALRRLSIVVLSGGMDPRPLNFFRPHFRVPPGPRTVPHKSLPFCLLTVPACVQKRVPAKVVRTQSISISLLKRCTQRKVPFEVATPSRSPSAHDPYFAAVPDILLLFHSSNPAIYIPAESSVTGRRSHKVYETHLLRMSEPLEACVCR